MSRRSDNPLLYHLLMGLGFTGLIGWFALMRQVGFMTWFSSLGPDSHTGALNMLAIMLWMLPAFLAWKYYLRWINRRLNVRGIYYEDSYYGADDNAAGSESKHQPTADTDTRASTDHKGPTNDR